MKIFITSCLLAFALAEPPVGDGYPAARSSHSHEHSIDFQRSLSQEYSVPEARSHSSSVHSRSQVSSYIPSSRTISQIYGTPGLRSGPSKEYSTSSIRSGPSQEYGTPGLRSGPSQEYGTPGLRSGPSQEYGTPGLRSGLSQEYGTPGFRSGTSQEYGTPGFRSSLSEEYEGPNLRSSPSQQYGTPKSRLSQQYGTQNLRNAPSTEYGTPGTRSSDYSVSSARSSQEYGVPQLRSGSAQEYKTIGDFPSDSYGTPLLRTPSTEYGQTGFRTTPSEEYGAPSQRSSSQRTVSSTSHKSSPDFRTAEGFNHVSHQHTSPLARQNKPTSVTTRSFQSSFGSHASKGFDSSRSVSNQYGAPNVRASDSYYPNTKALSQSYLPSSRTVSQTYGAPSERSLSSEYDAPEVGSDLKTNAFASSFDIGRSSPSSKYGVPSVRDAMPSDQYGVPEQYDSLSNQGYNYARNALDELLNQEPANYDFGYKVSDYASGSDFGHTETRQENKAEGSYFVVLPDGTKQIVEYEADERGFKPRISVEPAEARGYDDNASDLQRSEDGPY